MGKFVSGLLVGGVAVVAAIVAWLATLGGDVGVRTNGTVIKHDGTEIQDPTGLAAYQVPPPALQFEWQPPTGPRRTFHFDGRAVKDGASGGSALNGRANYLFRVSKGKLRVRRNDRLPDWLSYFKDVDLQDETGSHAVESMIEEEAFDLRDDFGGVGDSVVVAVTTTTPTESSPPKKRLYRIEIVDIEDKLP